MTLPRSSFPARSIAVYPTIMTDESTLLLRQGSRRQSDDDPDGPGRDWALLDSGNDPPPCVKRYLEKVAAAESAEELGAINAEAGITTDLPDGIFKGCAPPAHPRPSLWACLPCLRCSQDVRMRRPTCEGVECRGVFCSEKCALNFCREEAGPFVKDDGDGEESAGAAAGAEA